MAPSKIPQATPEELRRLKEVETFEAAADIAIGVMRRLAQDGSKVVQICGPMTTGGAGSFEANVARVERAVEIARGRGVVAFDQEPFLEALVRLCADRSEQGGYCYEVLEVYYNRIFTSGALAATMFLSGWESSTGAKWERAKAAALGLGIEEFPDEWFKE